MEELDEPLSQKAAVKLTLEIVLSGNVTYSKHALKEMEEDNIEVLDVRNVLRAGIMSKAAEWENESWRYRMTTAKFAVVFVFRSKAEIKVVTAWRFKKR